MLDPSCLTSENKNWTSMTHRINPAKKALAAWAVAAVAMTGTVAAAPMATAQPAAVGSSAPAAAPALPSLQNPFEAPFAGSSLPTLPPLIPQGDNMRKAAWDTRQDLNARIEFFPPQIRTLLSGLIDNVMGFLFSGLKEEMTKPAPAPAPAPAPPAPAPAPQNPCPAAAKACIDLTHQTSWLQEGGKITYGPVDISSGKPGWETPRGWHKVNRKVKDEYSRIFNNAPMPFSVYFTNDGVAFHEGSPRIMSNGCIHLWHNDAMYYYNNLTYGDNVYVF